MKKLMFKNPIKEIFDSDYTAVPLLFTLIVVILLVGTLSAFTRRNGTAHKSVC